VPPRPREFIARLDPYEWEAMASEVAAAAGIAEADVVRFDTNTSAWPPVAWERTVLDLPRLPANEYPHPSNEPLRSALARRFDVAPDQVVVTCGADEALFLLATAYLGPSRAAVTVDPYFSMFRVVTESVGATLRTLPVDLDWHVPLEALLSEVRQPNVGVVWLCSPNNPTGLTLSADFVRTVLRAVPDTLVALDEAYAEIAGASLSDVVLTEPNGVLVRTFSKGYGLAGARVGYLVAQRDVAQTVETIRLPQNMTAFGIAAACRALDDQDGLQRRVAEIVAERQRLARELSNRGWQLLPSEGNFVLGSPPRSAVDVANWLQSAGLIVRSYPAHPRLKDWVRIAVRSPEDDDRLLRRLDGLR
jgi:histidinol-phosphate aminotransferase